MRCRLCGKATYETKAVLVRVNEKGVKGIWECRPICGARLPDDDRILAAIEGVFEPDAPPAPKEEEARPRKIFDAGFSAKPSGAAREAADRPRIICLCGSTRFIEQFAIKTWELEREGFIVLGCTLLPMWYCKVPSHFGEATGTKEQCDKLHLRKIDLADEVLVLNIGGYIGESTANEIAYATRIGKPVKYIESDTAAASPAVPRDEDEAAEPRSKPATPLVSDCDPDD